jgi:hypothetical protein
MCSCTAEAVTYCFLNDRPENVVCLTYSMIQQDRLSRAPRLNRPGRRLLSLRHRPGVSGMVANEDLVGRVLQPCARLVQLPGSFANELAELVTIGNIRDCPKNQIRTHEVNLLPELSVQCYLALRYR